MTGITDLHATRRALQELAHVVKSTRQTLAAMLQENRATGPVMAGRLANTLEHLGEVREGFILSQRTSPQVSLSELRTLVQHVLFDWGWVQKDFNWNLTPADQPEFLDHQLVVFNHALVALAVLPRLPAEAITFPQRQPTYGDVSVPGLPGELLARIEEIERMIYQAEIQPVTSLEYEPFRRTYAFFEASSWLVNNYLAPFLHD